jgi:hypothetical protein
LRPLRVKCEVESYMHRYEPCEQHRRALGRLHTGLGGLVRLSEVLFTQKKNSPEPRNGPELGRRPCRDCAELLHHGELVGDSPVLVCSPIIAKTHDVDESHLDPFAGRGHSHE